MKALNCFMVSRFTNNKIKKAQTDTHTTNVYSSGIKNTMRKQKRCDGNQNAIGMKKGKRKKDERVTRTTKKLINK